MKIYKYRLPIRGTFKLELPKNSRILTVQIQDSLPYIWVEFMEYNEKDLESREFFIVTTGSNSTGKSHSFYIGTFQLLEGDFVGHIYENKM